MKHGFIKVAAAAPEIRVADPMFNADAVIRAMDEHARLGVKVLVFPELTLTGATCGDLFYQNTLLAGAAAALEKVVQASAGKDMLVFVGLPVAQGAKVYDAAAVVCNGELLGVVPASCPGDKHFALPGALLDDITVGTLGPVDFHAQQLFQHSEVGELTAAVLVGADVTAPVSPAVRHALAGATVLVEMAGFPMTTDSVCRVTTAVRAESAKLHAGVVLAAPGFGESSTDATYSGLCLIAEDGKVLESAEDGCSDVVTELDVQLLIAARRKDATFTGDAASYVVTEWGEGVEETVLTRPFGKYPYRPDDPADYHAAAKRLLHMQAASLVRRMQYANLKHPVVGISGGVDSTLAVIICAEAVKMMGLPADYVNAVTMPCFGTTDRTKSNAIIVSEQLGATVRVIDIGESVMQHFKDIGHDPENRNVVYENCAGARAHPDPHGRGQRLCRRRHPCRHRGHERVCRRLVHLQRRPHLHVRCQRRLHQDHGADGRALRRRDHGQRGARPRPCSTCSTRRSAPSCCPRRATARSPRRARTPSARTTSRTSSCTTWSITASRPRRCCVWPTSPTATSLTTRRSKSGCAATAAASSASSSSAPACRTARRSTASASRRAPASACRPTARMRCIWRAWTR